MAFKEERRVVSILSIFLCLIIEFGYGSESMLEVKTPYGTYKGHLTKSRGGKDIVSFRGIPYAQPPVGKLRFKEPVALEKSDKIIEANQDIICIQASLDMLKTKESENKTKYVGSEDCLYLNVYKPKDAPSGKLLPVYFWIHGGGFVMGSGAQTWSGPRYLIDGHNDMILVAINYRLSILGFLSANDDNLPGNLGLKDQTMALKWVKENIAMFGGDPESITIGGVSSGAWSVAHHLHSKASKGLFHKAISHSGTSDSPRSTMSTKDAREVAGKLINILGCPSEPEKLLTCLQELPAEVLLDSIETNKVKKISIMVPQMLPVVEKDSPTAFMTKDSIKEESNIPWLAGVTSQEALIIYQLLAASSPGILDLSDLKTDSEKLLPIFAGYGPKEGDDKITKELINFYFGDKGFGNDTVVNFIQLLSDTSFNYGLQVSAAKHKGAFYMYKFSYRGSITISSLRPNGTQNEVSHGDDIFFFFDSGFGMKVQLEEKEVEISNELTDMWYNFIAKGDPTPESHTWKESEGGNKYLDITNQGCVMSSDMFKERIAFLKQLDAKYNIQKQM